ncbi:MAG TPA: TerB family tellurite resistance protein [Rubrivivax sp.]|nr:TerB family tellurite resistance protein [Rubrivivax sp.]HPO18811.1 TerB family tellurite resistance protein [Rubrivivax sp.]
MTQAFAAPWAWPQTLSDYWIDAWQRTVLTWDVLRQRGNQYLEHEESGQPPVLVFDYDMVLDARSFAKPANYALVRIRPPAGCPVADAAKRPFVIIDPRAGHGPGIGGFKIDSEIGIALKHGHPCYFVMFFPQPVPGQTIESVCAAEVQFLRHVGELHRQADKPFVIGNCQGGWALLMAAALAPDAVGPLLLAGSPISYWAGVEGKNPMRYSGGLLGGSWMASLAGDIGHGVFDGAYLVNNFENLNPSNTYWSKLYNLYAKVDTEGERFLEFEKWWGGHYLMNKEEMEWISQNLFVGNKLASGQVESFDGKHRVDLRNIRTPIVVFASWGDNITPPQQALNWIADLYDSVDDIRLNEQTIVYCLHEKIGHLGIFVSAGIAQRETAELASALELIDTLPPGLYEAQIQDTTPDMPGLEYVEGRYLIQFAPRSIDDILALDDGRGDERAFEVAHRVSQINQQLYDRFASPVVKAMSSEPLARALREANPARLERWLFSGRNPAMGWLEAVADAVRAQRQPVAADNPLRQAEQAMSAHIEQSLDQYRDARDEMAERMFKAIYESPWLAAAVGIDAQHAGRRGARAARWEHGELKRMKRKEADAQFEQGTPLDAWARLLLYVGREEKVVDERPYNLMQQLVQQMKPANAPTPAALKAAIKRQAFVLALDEQRAIAALPKLAPDMDERRRGCAAARSVIAARGEPTAYQEQRLRHVAGVLGLDEPQPLRARKSA